MDLQYQIVHENKGSTVKSVLISVLCSVLATVLIGGTAIFFFVKNSTLGDETTTTDEDLVRRVEELTSRNLSYQESIEQLKRDLSTLEAKTKQMTVIVSETGKTVADVAEEALPSIVYISVYVPRYKTSSIFSFTESPAAFSGSGILYREKDGKTYVVTNYHVVEYVNEYSDVSVTVKTYDGTEYEASFIGGDKNNDVAVISIDATGLTIAKTSDVNKIRVGDVAIAIGNPLGEEYAGSVTVGYISALNRNISSENSAESLIQTDAAINPGNSGGALIDLNGNVIGITSSKIVSTNVEGIGFAIPIDYAYGIIEDLIEFGYVKDRPYIGILDGIEINALMSRYYDLPVGFYLTEIKADSPIVLAGLRPKDIIISVNGVAVSSLEEILKIVKKLAPGDSLNVTYYRNAVTYSATIIVGEDTGI